MFCALHRERRVRHGKLRSVDPDDPTTWSCNDLDVWVTSTESLLQVLHMYAQVHLPRALRHIRNGAEVRIRASPQGSAVTQHSSVFGIETLAALCVHLSDYQGTEYATVAEAARRHMLDEAGRFLKELHTHHFTCFRADVIAAATADVARPYEPPLSLNVMWYQNAVEPPSAMDIARSFDLDEEEGFHRVQALERA
ncbi:hypothetical protein N9L68_00850 [bacterium]|nr:hypothetical protein [bacterium]